MAMAISLRFTGNLKIIQAMNVNKNSTKFNQLHSSIISVNILHLQNYNKTTDNIGLNKSHATNTQEEHLYEKPSRSMKKIKELEMEI